MTAHEDRPASLARLRHEIESIDRSIVLLLAARLDAAGRALELRAGSSGKATDLAQERRVLRRARAWARDLRLPEKFVETLFRTLMEEGKARHRRGERSGEASGLVTLLMSVPEGVPVAELGNGPHAQLAAVPVSR